MNLRYRFPNDEWIYRYIVWHKLFHFSQIPQEDIRSFTVTNTNTILLTEVSQSVTMRYNTTRKRTPIYTAWDSIAW